jgi:hypothetical protein
MKLGLACGTASIGSYRLRSSARVRVAMLTKVLMRFDPAYFARMSPLGRVRSPRGPELRSRALQNTVALEMRPYLSCAKISELSRSTFLVIRFQVNPSASSPNAEVRLFSGLHNHFHGLAPSKTSSG